MNLCLGNTCYGKSGVMVGKGLHEKSVSSHPGCLLLFHVSEEPLLGALLESVHMPVCTVWLSPLLFPPFTITGHQELAPLNDYLAFLPVNVPLLTHCPQAYGFEVIPALCCRMREDEILTELCEPNSIYVSLMGGKATPEWLEHSRTKVQQSLSFLGNQIRWDLGLDRIQGFVLAKLMTTSYKGGFL